VVALGGDGLVGSCAEGLVGTGTVLAVVPAGNGNDPMTREEGSA
jgi:diacylglycerol kinase family enzyme